MSQGADDYLVKAFDVDTVVLDLDRALQKKLLEREVAEHRLHLEKLISKRTYRVSRYLE